MMKSVSRAAGTRLSNNSANDGWFMKESYSVAVCSSSEYGGVNVRRTLTFMAGYGWCQPRNLQVFRRCPPRRPVSSWHFPAGHCWMLCGDELVHVVHQVAKCPGLSSPRGGFVRNDNLE